MHVAAPERQCYFPHDMMRTFHEEGHHERIAHALAAVRARIASHDPPLALAKAAFASANEYDAV